MERNKFDELIKEVKHDMDKMNIPYNNDFKIIVGDIGERTWGRCYVYRAYIEISYRLVNYGKDKDIKNCICHELIHTTPQCKEENHGKNFKFFANRMNSIGYNVKRVNNYELDEEAYKNVKYIVKCKKCGHIFNRYRMSNIVKYTSLYGCQCGGKLIRIK